MADSSFDVVSKVDRQEVDNALNQAAKELSTRFDFRGTDTSIAWKGEEAIEIVSSTEERVKAAVDVFKESDMTGCHLVQVAGQDGGFATAGFFHQAIGADGTDRFV